MSGPLAGLRVVELVGQGPGPFGGMVLADLGADVVAVARPDEAARADRARPATNPLMRGKRSVALDLKMAEGAAAVLELTDRADVLIDPFRPGVCERLGVGPEVVCARNPRLVYARMTGFGQDGPLAQAAGHDIDYIALSGALFHLGYEGQPPTMPINLLGDFAGGGLLMALGVAAAVVERAGSGRGQVIDCAMVDGAALVFGPMFAAVASGMWGPRGTNFLDGGAPFYQVYETADGGWVAVGAIEAPFYAALLAGLGAEDDGGQWDRAAWPERKARWAAIFRSRTRDEWCSTFDGTDACVTPVLAADEAHRHPHVAARGTLVERNGVRQPQAAPRFGRTPGEAGVPCHPGQHAVDDVLRGWSR